ncbi:hypothetical protein [Roseofilum casamattae]|uniref:GerMN domain-containing protein n=1 Tax=Roseofilum casamattae BLCC-M143 TaxID=3022442 RepID=A0ABT7C2Z9_9CYAN|nr:hypothetical protein [Roseofilum casamattae]MDJ1185800.1 hypothetical protein [Roseofilum casamattae BLCC-M143]
MIRYWHKGAMALLTGMIVVVLNGCAISSTSSSPSATLSVSGDSEFAAVNLNAERQTVTFYYPDALCETFISTPIEVSVADGLSETVNRVIEQGTTADFRIAGYRIQPEPGENKVAIDFRLAPDSQRVFVSLSTCERFALLGSLRKTLTEHEAWNIDEVSFTYRGRAIAF